MSIQNNILKGLTIITTHPTSNFDILIDGLANAGANVYHQALIKIEGINIKQNTFEDKYDRIVFTSKNGIKHFFDKNNLPKEINISVLGSATANQLECYGLKANFIGKAHNSIEFADELKNIIIKDEKILLIVGESADHNIETMLAKYAKITRINIYKTIFADNINDNIKELISKDNYNLITITSPSAFKSLTRLIDPKFIKTLKIGSIGSTTTKYIQQFQVNPLITSNAYSYKGLFDSILQYFAQKG
ncbi:MAG: hypothetical protein A2X12_06380 [Bacteroidetes bacterium GWE2_29_8]|nr:MAG: hypothetical protein A2X12_06380 [Bacteroidetes bacterium GWE2_29_8]